MVTQEPSNTSAQETQVALSTFNLQALLPSHYKLELSMRNRLVSILNTTVPCIITQEQFTKNEWAIFIALLTFLPYYAPYEVLLASVTSLSPVDCCKRLREAEELGAEMIKQELKPVHRALSGIRPKLVNLFPDLKVSLIRNLGYTLTVAPATDKVK